MGNKQLIEIASWRIVSELYRRHPDKFKIIETHPGGGQYDCLSLYTDNKHIADFNRVGRLHVFEPFTRSRNDVRPYKIWDAMLREHNLKKVLDKVSLMIGLKVPKKLPPSNPTTIVYRFIAAFLSHAVFGINEYECRNGFLDSSGESSEVVSDFDKFPEARERLEVVQDDDILREPSYRFWFLKKNNQPLLCIETTGFAWNLRNQRYNLMKLYREKRRIWDVVYNVAGEFLS